MADMSNNLFKGKIENWQDWGNIFQSIPAFSPLIEYIFLKENLSLTEIEPLTPGTNAVFKIGNYVLKIFAPLSEVWGSGDPSSEYDTELFAINRAYTLGINTPRPLCWGLVKDKYKFAYIITMFIDGLEFTEALKTMGDREKYSVAGELRVLTDKMNIPCEPFNDIDVINDKSRQFRWEKYPEKFKEERIGYIKGRDFGEKVFVHGDLCGDNILLSPQGGLYIIDFADAVLAPIIYEQALVAVELFELDPALLRGYFGDMGAADLADLCFNGLLIHDYGGDILNNHIGKISDMDSLDKLGSMILRAIQSKLK